MRRCKTLISALLCVMMLSSAVSAFAYDFSYDATANTFSVLEGGDGTNTIIVVKPYDDAELTVDYINNNNVLYKVISKSETLPYEMVLFGETGRHMVVMNDGTTEESLVLNMADTGLFASLLTAVDSGDFAEALADYPAFGTPYAGAADILAASEPRGGYDANALSKAYNLGEGLSRVADGDIDMVQFFSEYYIYLDDEVAEEYAELNAKELTALASVNEAICYPTYDVNYAAECALVIAKIKVAKNADEVKEICLDYIEKYDVDTDDYDDIRKDYYKDRVFSGILSDRADIDTDTDLIAAFEKHSEKQLKAYKDSQKEQGGATGGGGYVRQEDPAKEEENVFTGFSDISGHWAEKNILAMYHKGIINGFTDGTFRPEDNVTRAEFVKMFVSALNLEIGGAVQFDDVVPEDWHYAYIATAFNAGIVNGVGTGFNPDGAITRQDASAIVYRAIMAGEVAEGVTFADDAEIADYAKAAVAALSAKGIILGSDGYFNPTDNMTRAEAATIIQRILQ